MDAWCKWLLNFTSVLYVQGVAIIQNLLLWQTGPFQEVWDPHHSLNEKNTADSSRNVKDEKKNK